MAWLRKIAGSAVRGAGNVLAVHVLPDTLIPSWQTRNYLASRLGPGGRSSSGSKKKKKKPGKKKHPSSRPPARSRPTFNKNAWGRGASLVAPPAYSSSPSTSRPPGGASPSFSAMVRKRGQQLRDLRREPRLVLQMHLDELLHSVRTIKPQPRKQKHPN